MAVDDTRLQSVFRRAAEAVDPASRAAILDLECAADAELRGRVEELLKDRDVATVRQHPAALHAGQSDASDGTVAIQDAIHEQTTVSSSAQSSALLADGMTLPPAAGEDGPPALDFLEPSTKSGSLGRLGHYEVLEVLGQGGFGIVLRTFDEKLQRVVAIKVLSPQLASTSPARKRFLREARAAARVRHENIVQIHAVEEQPLPYLVMEYIPGQTLQQKLDEKGPLDVSEILTIGGQIARGLAAAHEQGLIHRDVKPGNILLESGVEPRVKITDFGLARTADDASMSQSGMISGTPLYMAPEQAQGESLDYRVDLFSLGSVLYAMASGRPPFRAGTTLAVIKRVAEEDPRPIREIIPEVPEWLCNVIARVHVKDPALRWRSAAEVADLLGRHLAHLRQPTLVPRPESVAVPKPANPRTAAAWAVAAAVLVALVAVATYPFWRPAPSIPPAPAAGGGGVAALPPAPVLSSHELQGPAAVRDALLDFGEPERNFGGAERDNALRRGEQQVTALLVRFDLEKLDLSPQAAVAKATLSFYVWDPSSQGKTKVAAFPLLTAWEEYSATWRQPGAGKSWRGESFALDADAGPAGPAVIVDPDQDGDTLDPPREYQLDVTELVRAWLSGKAANHGLAIAPVIDSSADAGVLSRFQVYGSEDWRVQFTPKLTVQSSP